MSDTVKTILKWFAYLVLSLVGGAAGGAGSQVLF